MEGTSPGSCSEDVNSILNVIERELVEMEEEAKQFDSADSKVSGYQTTKENLIMRHLLLLFKGKEMNKHRSKIGQHLSALLIRKNGILEFIQSTCDLDSSSEVKTNFDQRFRALSTVIINMPTLCCPLEDYYYHLGIQLFQLLPIPQDHSFNGNLWRLAAHLLSSLLAKNRTLGHKKLIRPLLAAISGQSPSVLTLPDALITLHRLVLSNCDKNLFTSVFPNLLAIYSTLCDTPSPHKQIVKEIVIDILKYVDHSLYLLDEALSSHLDVIARYKTGLIRCGNKEILTVIMVEKDAEESVTELKMIDKSVQSILIILSDMDNEFCLNLFLLLVEKINQQSTRNQLLVFSLVDSLQDRVSNLILDYPALAIQFIINTLRRVTTNDTQSIQSMLRQVNVDIGTDQEIEKNSKIIHDDSLSMAIQIVTILLEAKERLGTNEISSLKSCQVHLERVLTRSDLNKSEKDSIKELVQKLNNLSDSSGPQSRDSLDSKYREALDCLNSRFLPQRAHGLVVLRNLIDSRCERTIEDRNQLFTLIKACLSDPDSYVYLAAVNALASMALAHTKECLPTLIEAYHDKTRSIRERVSVGESLVWVCKYLGQMSHHYHRSVTDCFLNGLKDEDESIRVSSLSNLGQFCSSLKHSLSYCITEIIYAVESLLKTDSCYDVKRASLMFLHIMLNGLGTDSIEVILDHLKTIHRLIKSIDSKSLGDDLIRVHAHLALEAIDYHMKLLIKPSDDLIRPIKF